MRRSSILVFLVVMSFVLSAVIIGVALAYTNLSPAIVPAPSLGSASSFAVLGGTTVTNTGPSVLNGDLGVSPGSAITGFGPGLVHGAKHTADAVALQAQKDVTTAYNAASAAPCTHNLTGQDLGGKSLVSGVYCFSSSAQLTGTLILTGSGVFIFQVASKLTTASDSGVSVEGADPCHVFWQIGSSATIGTDTNFVGNILALTSIHAQTGATVTGGLYARNGEVTLDHNTVNRSSCVTTKPTPTPTTKPHGVPTGTPTDTPTPEVGLG